MFTPLQSAAEPDDASVATGPAPTDPSPPGGLFTRIPLRVRLTLWVMLLLGITQLVLGSIFLLYQQSAADEFFNTRVRLRYGDLLAEITTRLPAIDSPELSDIARAKFRFERLVEGYSVSIYDDDGRLIASTPGVIDAHLAASARAATPEKPFLSRFPHSRLDVGDHSALRSGRLVGASVRGADGRNYVVLGAMSDDYGQRLTDTFYRTFLLSIVMGLVASAFAGWLIAGFATRPIEQLRAMARRLGPLSMNTKLWSGTLPPEAAALRAELDAARARIATAFAAQERFISNVSHELKTPIAVLLTQGQTLDRRALSSAAAQFVDSACDEMRRLGSMIESFLTLSQVSSGRAVRPSAVCPLNDLVMESASHCAAMADQHKVTLEPLLTESFDVRVVGDITLLRTMIDNLIRNAIKFSPAGERVQIVVSVVKTSVALRSALDPDAGLFPDAGTPPAGTARPFVPDPAAQITIRDFGPGIPANILPRIFDRFVQAPEEQRLGRGHGLGLEIAQGVAELHGGTIDARNVAPKGCEFAITLPILNHDKTTSLSSRN